MKTKYILAILFLMISAYTSGQSIPGGMNYQAVARGKAGEVLANHSITLKINLQSQGLVKSNVYYSEIHHAMTNQSGLFSIVIGTGSIMRGSFTEIPWSTENIWMEVGIQEESASDFIHISNTELLAVPYAFHAGTASELSGNYIPYILSGSSASGNSTLTGVPATSWKVTGNSASNPPIEYLGNSDCKDLVFKTVAIEQMRVFCNGNVSITNSLNIGIDITVGHDGTINHDLRVKNDALIDSNLTVKKNVRLNTFAGSTINNGPFTVGNVSPTIMTGSLRVDGSTNLNNGLNVNNMKPTLLTGTLKVNNATDLFSSFTINDQSPAIMTGTLRVDSNVTFKNHLTLSNPAYNSFNSTSGELVVAGGVGVAKNLNVGGDAKIAGKTELHGQVKITDPRPSTIPDSGALVVAGGVGIGKQLSVGGYSHLYDSLKIEGATTIQNSLVVNDSVILKNKLNVSGLTQLNGSTKANGQVTINAPSLASGIQTDYNAYPLQVQGGKQGIAINVNSSKSNGNNFVSFWDNNGMQGRIEGYAPGEYLSTKEYENDSIRIVTNLTLFSIMDAVAIARAVVAGGNLSAALSSSTGCLGLGACVTTPIPSLIASAIAGLANQITAEVSATIKLDSAIIELTDLRYRAHNKTGVTYESGAGDYAEYLQMQNKDEVMLPGDIVGLKDGKISRNTNGADKIMVLSIRPIVLGNMPKDGNDNGYKKVAFLGQVTVKVRGIVHAGDYIIPNGNNDGMGIAISPEQITSADIKNIVGVAWTSSENSFSVNSINVAVGLNVNDNSGDVTKLESNVDALKTKLTERNARLEKLVSGFKSFHPISPLADGKNNANTPNNSSISSSDHIVYFEVSREEIERGVDLAEKQIHDCGKNIEDIPGFNKFKSDPTFRSKLIDQIQLGINEDMENRKAIDAKFAK